MSLTIAATVLDDLAAVRLVVGGAAAGPLVITRVDHNGSSVVRLLPGQAVSGGSLIVTDYEPALFGDVTYTVVDSGAASASSAAVRLDGTAPTIASVATPQLRSSAVVLDLVEANRDTGTEHTVLDDAAPLVVISAPSTRRVTVTAWMPTYRAAAQLREVLTARQTVYVRYADFIGADVYGTPRSVTVNPERTSTTDGTTPLTRRWLVVFELVETGRPTGPLMSAAGWTFALVAAAYDDLADLAASFPTFDALTVGP